ncbi:MAG: phosphate ABC transporter permease PstA [Spirochaetales bacterium]|nr:phosphate ABC transporter permease PstA [Spirochaetales bacterium]
MTQQHTSFIYKAFIYGFSGLTALLIVIILGYITIKGVVNITPSLFSLKYNSENVSLLPSLINSILMMIITLFVAIPIGLGSAIYTVEYSKKGSKFIDLVRLCSVTLSGIPSIVYGLFGLLFFVTKLHFGLSLLSGSLTLAIMVLPSIFRTSEEALLSVPQTFREASFALGAGKIITIFKAVIPSAIPGILSGVILASGRIIGESAALLYTAGTVAQTPSSLFSSTRTMAVHMYVLSSEGLYLKQAFATGFVLVLIIVVMNALSVYLAKKVGVKNG